MIRFTAAVAGFLMVLSPSAMAWPAAMPPDGGDGHIYLASLDTAETEPAPLTANERVVAARLAYDRAAESAGGERIAALEEALDHLRAVIRDHPSSDHAVTLVGGGAVAGVSIPGIEAELETARAALDTDTAAGSDEGGAAEPEATAKDEPEAAARDEPEAAARDEPEAAARDEPEATGQDQPEPADAVAGLAPRALRLTVRLPSSAELAEGAPRLGVEFSTRSPAIQNALATTANGALVIDVIAGSVAEKAGVRIGDFIIGLADRALSEPADLARIVGDLPSGIAAPLELIRVGEGIDDLRAMLIGRAETSADEDRGMALAALGDLALIGRTGDGALADAHRYYRAATEAGDGYATYILARYFDDGNGGPEDDTEAARLYKLAIERGQPIAAFHLGELYWIGSGVTEDNTEAVRLFRMAAASEMTQAYIYLGVAHQYGLGAETDAEAARDWYMKSAAAGHTAAGYRLGVFYRNGDLGTPDLAEARRLFEQAATAGIVAARRDLGVMVRDGQGGPADDARAAELFRQAADAGDGAAMYYLGAMYLNGRIGPADPEAAIAWLTKAVDTGILQAHHWLALAHADLPASSQRAGTIADHLIAAIRAGDTTAIESLTERAREWSAAVRRAVQERLRDLGHYAGAIDGSFGPGTRRAIEALAEAA